MSAIIDGTSASSLSGALAVTGATTLSSTLGVTGVATLGNGAILGTPASGTVTNLTGTASININGTVGATTPAAVAATTGTFSNALTVTHNNYNGITSAGSSDNSISLRIQNTFAGARNWNLASSGGGVAPNGSFVVYDDSGGGSRLTIDSSGNVGIGTTSPSSYGKLTVDDTSHSSVYVRSSSTNFAGLLLENTNSATKWQIGVEGGTYNTAGKLNIGISGTGSALIIDASRRVLVNSASDVGGNNPAFSVNGDSFSNGMESRWTGTMSFYNLLIRNGNGLIGGIQTSGSTTSFLTSSDYRLKNTIAPMTGALDKVALLKPCTYKWKVDGSDGQGFIAHELQEVVPGCVTGEKDATREEEYEVTPAVPAVVDADGVETTPAVQAVKSTRTVPSYQGVDTSFLVATLTAAIQELKAIIDTQAIRIAALENTP